MIRLFSTENPDEADRLEEELQIRSIPYEVVSEDLSSGLTKYSFFVPRENFEKAINLARIARARLIRGDDSVRTVEEARSVIAQDTVRRQKNISNLSDLATQKIAWKYRHIIALAAAPLSLPATQRIVNTLGFENDDIVTWSARLLSFVIVTLAVLGLIKLSRLKTQ